MDDVGKSAHSDVGGDEDGNGEADVQVDSPGPTSASDKPMSKNQMKKLAKMERMRELKVVRRAQENVKKKARKEQRKQELTEVMQSMTPEEQERLRKQHQDTRMERNNDHKQRRCKLAQSLQDGPDLVIDLDFGGMMTDSELKHLCQQLSYSYSCNGKVAEPCHLHLVGWKGDVKEMTEKQIVGLPNWYVTKTGASFVEHFAERRDKLVYLTADSQTELDQVDPHSIYIIGGIVDHNRYKGLCMKRAEEAGIATARLPILKYVKLDSRAVLTVNHVVQIMVEMHNRHDWQAVLDEVLPPRKRADFQAAKAAAQQAAEAEAAAAEAAAAAGATTADARPEQPGGAMGTPGMVATDGGAWAEAADIVDAAGGSDMQGQPPSKVARVEASHS